MDFQAAMDRGSDTVIGEKSYNTRLPMSFDDSQILSGSSDRPSVLKQSGQAIFFMVGCECTRLVRVLNFVQVRNDILWLHPNVN